MRAPKPADSKRSILMARVRRTGTAAERDVGAALRAMGCSYRLNERSLPGSPDFANRRRNWVVFVHGCFWHHHTGCKRATVPKTNEAFWRQKFATNRSRDAHAIRALRRKSYRTVIVWECEISKPGILATKLSQILESRRVNVAQAVDH